MTGAGRVVIIPLTLEYVEQAGRLFEVSITDAFAREGLGHLQDDILKEIAGKKALVQASLDMEDTDIRFWVAQIDGEVVGTISYAPSGEDIRAFTGGELDDLGEMGTLYIMPEFQGRGIASALIAELVAYLRMQGIARFCLDSGYKRAQAKWLRKFGEPYKVIEDYWGPGSPHMIWVCAVSKFGYL